MDVVNWFLSFSERKKQIGVSITSAVAGFAILIGYFQMGPSALNYAEAQAIFKKWSASPNDEVLYTNLKEVLRNAPTLQKRYEGTIAQKLIHINKLEEALVMANRSLSRVKDEIPYHATYATTSLLIEQHGFQEALEKAVALKEQMGDSFLTENKGGSLLYVHNLLRIACLQQELHNKPGEKAAWEELELFLQTKSKTAEIFLGSFSDKQLDLTQYILERKKAL